VKTLQNAFILPEVHFDEQSRTVFISDSMFGQNLTEAYWALKRYSVVCEANNPGDYDLGTRKQGCSWVGGVR